MTERGQLICTCLLSEGTDVEEPVTSLHNSWCNAKSGERWIRVEDCEPNLHFDDGLGSRSVEEAEHRAYRPDLPPCNRCDSGTACNCQVYWQRAPWYQKVWRRIRYPRQGTFVCACMGFVSCPKCPREMGVAWMWWSE